MRKILLFIFLLVTVITTTGAGYVGTLPNVEAEFLYMRKEKNDKASAPYSIEQLDKQNEQNLKPIPRNDDTYIDIVIKRDKSSKYTNDINSVLNIIMKLRKCLNTNQDIQMFNAIVSNLIDNIEYIHKEYQDKDESNYLSYNKLLELSKESREVALFRTQGFALQKYMPYSNQNNIYTKENLEKKLDDLLKNVNDTIYVINNLE